jgi:hypothetical protein
MKKRRITNRPNITFLLHNSISFRTFHLKKKFDFFFFFDNFQLMNEKRRELGNSKLPFALCVTLHIPPDTFCSLHLRA